MSDVKSTSDLKSFHYLESGEVVYSNFRTEKSIATLDPGFYKMSWLAYPHNRVQLDRVQQREGIKIYPFPDKKKVEDAFEAFFNESIVVRFNKFEFNRKLGILLYGIEGGGKTTISTFYSNKFVKERGATVFYISLEEMDKQWDFIINVRKIQSNPIIVVFDEFDEFLVGDNSGKKEGLLKSILDGHLSIDNCIFFAATNYIEEIPKTIKDRPSRFKYCLEIKGIEDASDVRKIIDPMLKDILTEEQICVLVEKLTGQTLDVIKQTCIDKWMKIKTYSKERRKIGFKLHEQ